MNITAAKKTPLKRRTLALLLAAAMTVCLWSNTPVSAKTAYSEKGQNIFFYALNAEGDAILLKVVTLDELKALSHGQLSYLTSGEETGVNYYISTTDNYPTTQYCEVRGFTVPELVDYIKTVTTVQGADRIMFSGGDTIRLMATDSFGNYNRSWSYDELYGVERYYFEGLYDKDIGWKLGWEVAGEEISKYGIDLETYHEEYMDKDLYYEDKRAVFETGELTLPIIATESFSGRTTTAALVASTEIGIAEYVEDNEGVVGGCLAEVLEDTWSLRLALPMTEADLMGARRTAFDNFKWIYNLRLDMTEAPELKNLGAVAEPVVDFSISGSKMTISVSCSTPGATVYYSFDGSPQIEYTGRLTVDVTGRNLSADPVTVYVTAVREGYSDAGIVIAKYPGLAPAFKTVSRGITGQELVFEAAEGVSSRTWTEWADSMQFVTMKTPSGAGYLRVDNADFMFNNNAKSVTFGKSLFNEAGSYSFVFHASGYADKNVSLTIKKPATEVVTPIIAKAGMPLTFRFDDPNYQDGLTLYVTSPQGVSSVMIATSWLERTKPGRVTLKAAYFESAACEIREPGEYSFNLVNNSYTPATLTVTFTIEAGSIPGFDDVKPENWYYDAVRFCLGAELIDPAAELEFGANLPMTRRAFAEALYRLAGSPEVSGNSPFSDADVPSVLWAYDAGIVNGMDDGRFAPDDSITREQIAAMLRRYAALAESGLDVSGNLAQFTDCADISDWALDSLAWANGAGLITGMGGGTIAPQGTASRAQVAQILLNYAG